MTGQREKLTCNVVSVEVLAGPMEPWSIILETSGEGWAFICFYWPILGYSLPLGGALNLGEGNAR